MIDINQVALSLTLTEYLILRHVSKRGDATFSNIEDEYYLNGPAVDKEKSAGEVASAGSSMKLSFLVSFQHLVAKKILVQSKGYSSTFYIPTEYKDIVDLYRFYLGINKI